MSKTILVTGVTGQQGHEVARALLHQGHHVRGMTRDPNKVAARELHQVGVKILEGGLDDPATIRHAATDVDAVFLVDPPTETGLGSGQDPAHLGLPALQEAGVPHVIYSSIANADQRTGVPQFEAKANTETLVRTSGIPFTIVAPAFLRDNLFAPWLAAGLVEGNLVMALPPHRGLQTIGVPEIGRFVAAVVTDPQRFEGQRIDLASDETTPIEIAHILSEAAGRTIRHLPVSLDDVRHDSPRTADLFSWLDRVGFQVDIQGLRHHYPEVGWSTFSEWAKEQEWDAVINAAMHA